MPFGIYNHEFPIEHQLGKIKQLGRELGEAIRKIITAAADERSGAVAVYREHAEAVVFQFEGPRWM